MTQDPHGQPAGSGYVVRGEVVPDDEVDATAPNAPTRPMTQFQKVASALGGDRTDPSMPIPADPADLADPSDLADPADATRPEPVVAVRSPDGGSGDSWDEADETGPREPAAASADTPAADAGTDTATQDPTTTQPDIYGTTARTPADGATAAADAVDAGTAAADAGAADAGAAAEAAESSGGLLPDVAEFRAQWQQVQFQFVDDPRGSVTEAADVVAQVAAKLEAAIQERQRALRDRWDEDTSADTESLRETLLLYRAFLNQLTGSK